MAGVRAEQGDYVGPGFVTQSMEFIHEPIVRAAQLGQRIPHVAGFGVSGFHHPDQVQADVDPAVEIGLIGLGDGVEDTGFNAAHTACIRPRLGRVGHQYIHDLARAGYRDSGDWVACRGRQIRHGGMLQFLWLVFRRKRGRINLAQRVGFASDKNDFEGPAVIQFYRTHHGSAPGGEHYLTVPFARAAQKVTNPDHAAGNAAVYPVTPSGE